MTLVALSAALSGVLPGAMPDEAPAPNRRGDRSGAAGNGPTAVYVRGGRGVSLDAALYPATAVGLTALSSGMDARLYRALRIERSLAYTIAGDLTPAATAPSALVLASCDPENVDEVVAVMDAEIARITTEPLSAAELQRAKRYLIGRQALRRQRNQEVAHYLALFELLGGSQGYRRDLLLAGRSPPQMRRGDGGHAPGFRAEVGGAAGGASAHAWGDTAPIVATWRDDHASPAHHRPVVRNALPVAWPQDATWLPRYDAESSGVSTATLQLPVSLTWKHTTGDEKSTP